MPRSCTARFLACLTTVALFLLSLSGCFAGADGKQPLLAPVPLEAGKIPRDIAHIVVVVEENHSFDDIIGNPQAPFINRVAASGALFTQAYGVEHPSQPNYLDLFSGSNQGIVNDSCPHTFSGPNLAHSLIEGGRSFVGYSEDLPAPGYTGCTFGSSDSYWRKHNPWVDFTNLPSSINQPFSAFPTDFTLLPTVSFVIPNEAHDMHNGTIAQADEWLKSALGGYLTWARNHHSLLILTWDESEGSAGNHIPLVIAGAQVAAGRYSRVVNHFSVLRTIEEIYSLDPIGASARVAPISRIWK